MCPTGIPKPKEARPGQKHIIPTRIMMRRAEPYLPDLGNNQTNLIILGQTTWILHSPSPQLHSLNASQPLLTSTPCSLYISMSFTIWTMRIYVVVRCMEGKVVTSKL